MLNLKRKVVVPAVVMLLCAASVCAENERDSVELNGYPIDDVVVTGVREEADPRLLPMTVNVVKRKEIERRHTQSLLPLLSEQVPGLFVTSRGVMGYGVSTGAAGGMSLRGVGGSPTSGLLVLIDGHPQYMGLMGHPIADAYQSMIAEKVEVVRGPASMMYGSNAMGGVINIVTRKRETEGVETTADVSAGSYGTVVAEASNSLKLGRWSSTVTASYNRSDGHRADMGFEQYGGYAKVGYEISGHWDVYADVNVTHFNASNPGTVDAPLYDNDSHITRGMTSIVLRNEYGRTSGALSVFFNWGRHRIDDGYHAGEEPQSALFNSRDMMAGVSLYQSMSLFRGNKITLGFDYQHFGGRSWNEVKATGEDVPGVDRAMDELAGYVEMRQSFGNWLSLNAGVRADYHTQTGTELVPQGGLAFHLPANAELKAVVSKGFRNPTIREMYILPPRNPVLRPERLMNYELSVSQRLPGQRLRYGVNLYYINGNNVINSMIVDGRPLFVNTGRIENWGAEAKVAYEIDIHWRVNANYSWLHMEHPVVSAPEHKLYAGADFNMGRWSASTGLQYVHGLYTAVGENEHKENFLLWNVRGSFRVFRWMSIYVTGENLLAWRYEVMAGYPMPGATAMGGVRFTI